MKALAAAMMKLMTPMALAAALAGSASAQVWTAPVLLGKSSQSSPSLSMAGAGYAGVAFNFTGNGGNAVGTIYQETIQGSHPWTKAAISISSSIDPYQVGLGQDASGADFIVFGAGQFDNLSSAYVGCLQNTAAGYCGAIASSGAVQHPPAVRFFGSSTDRPNTAVYLYDDSCKLLAGDTAGGSQGVLTQGGDCVSAFDLALSASGAGVAVFRTQLGALESAVRGSGPAGTWSAVTSLSAANSLNGSISAAAAASGEATAAWTVGKRGTRTIQVWTATLSSAGTWEAPAMIASNACDTTVGVAMTAAGDTAVAYAVAGATKSGCEAVVALRPASGNFAAPVRLTSGAHAKAAAVAATPAGNFVVAWSEGPAPMIRAASGSLGGFSAPQTIGAYAGAPVLAAAGGYVNAAWCSGLCYASTLVLP